MLRVGYREAISSRPADTLDARATASGGRAAEFESAGVATFHPERARSVSAEAKLRIIHCHSITHRVILWQQRISSTKY